MDKEKEKEEVDLFNFVFNKRISIIKRKRKGPVEKWI